MAEEEPFVLCYNKGCGQQYKESQNTETSCRFHPGDHFFHDAYKGWSCCNRKTVDFTEFLNMKGCAYSFHSNVKPPEVEKKKELIDDILENTPAQPVYQAMKRPPLDDPMIGMKKELSDSLKKQTYSSGQSSTNGTTEAEKVEVIAGVTQCVNTGCKTTYQGPESDSEVCHHHPGVPIFHEGLKFWSCCQKRTTEFEVFMAQKGCATGSHLWVKPKENTHDVAGAKVVKCRQDWHQTGTHVILVIYAKKFDPNVSEVKVNGVKLSIELYFPEENGYFREEWILAGIIVPEQCSVLMTPMKLEIKLKKAEPVSWKNLSLPKEGGGGVRGSEKADEPKNEFSVGVDPLDLTDL